MHKINTLTSFQTPNENIWLGDSGASCHFTNDDTGKYSTKVIHDAIGTGDGGITYATKEGSIRLQVVQQNGETSRIVLTDCKYIPNLPTNLFSITSALLKGWKLSNNGIRIKLTKDGQHIIFETIDRTSRGVLMTVKMIPINEEYNEMRQPFSQVQNQPYFSALPAIKPYNNNIINKRKVLTTYKTTHPKYPRMDYHTPSKTTDINIPASPPTQINTPMDSIFDDLIPIQ
jgi:hypothetical protein